MVLDPELMNQGGLHELEKTAGEAIAFSAALQSAARVARGAVQQQQQQQQQQQLQQQQLQEEDDNERELRRQIGGFIQQSEGVV
jgi:cell division protein FtsB